MGRRKLEAGAALTEEDLERLHASYWEGGPLDLLAEAAGIEPVTLLESFSEAGMPTLRPEDKPDRRATGRPPRAARVKRKERKQRKTADRPDARTRRMHEMYAAGATLGEVGERFGLTRERVRQIFQESKLPQPSLEERRRKQIDAHRDSVRTAFEQHGEVAAVAEELGITKVLVNAIVREDPAWARRFKVDGRSKKRYSDEELMACLREAAAEWDGPLTGAKYDWYAGKRTFPNGRPWPGKQTFILRYETWRGALEKAGVAANPPSAIAGRRKFDKGRCIGALRHAAVQLGKTPTAAEYERLAKDSGGTLPSGPTIRHRFGTWHNALREADL